MADNVGQGGGSQETTGGRPGRDAGREDQRPPSVPEEKAHRGVANHLRRYSWQERGPRPKERPIATAYYKHLFTEIPLEMRRAKAKDKRTGEKVEHVLFQDGTTWLDLAVRATLQRAASGEIRAMKEIHGTIEGQSGLRMEVFRETFDDEIIEDPLARSIMDLDPVDRKLFIAASNKVLTLIKTEVSVKASEGVALGTETKNVTETADAESTPGPHNSSGGANL